MIHARSSSWLGDWRSCRILPAIVPLFLGACDEKSEDRAKPTETSVSESAVWAEKLGREFKPIEAIPVPPKLAGPAIPRRGAIRGTVSFFSPIMEGLAERRPTPFFTVLFVEEVPESLWTQEEAAPEGRLTKVFLTDRYCDIPWGRRSDNGWLCIPASVLALERGERFEFVFTYRYLERYGLTGLYVRALDETEQFVEPFFPNLGPRLVWPVPRGYPTIDESEPPRVVEEGRVRWGEMPTGQTYGQETIKATGGVYEFEPGLGESESLYLVAVQNPFHTTIDLSKDREFRIENVPPGELYLRAFDAHFETVRFPVTVEPGRTTDLDVVFRDIKRSVPKSSIYGEDAKERMPAHWHDRGVNRHIRGDLEGAIEDYEATLAIDPQYWRAWATLGLALAQRGDRKGAGEAFDRALVLAPTEERAEIEAKRGEMLGE